MYKHYMEKIDFNSNKDKIIDLIEMLMNNAEKTDKKLYNFVCSEMYELVYGQKLNLEMAEKWVKSMTPMAKWSKEETDNVKNSKGLNVDDIDFYVAMNKMYSDYGKVITQDMCDEKALEKYIEMALAYLEDADAKPNKVYLEYKYVFKRD